MIQLWDLFFFFFFWCSSSPLFRTGGFCCSALKFADTIIFCHLFYYRTHSISTVYVFAFSVYNFHLIVFITFLSSLRFFTFPFASREFIIDYFLNDNCLSLSAQATRTQCCRLGWLKEQKWTWVTLLEAGKPKTKALADLVSGEGPLPGLQMAFIVSSLGRENRHSGVFSNRESSSVGSASYPLNHI